MLLLNQLLLLFGNLVAGKSGGTDMRDVSPVPGRTAPCPPHWHKPHAGWGKQQDSPPSEHLPPEAKGGGWAEVASCSGSEPLPVPGPPQGLRTARGGTTTTPPPPRPAPDVLPSRL